jgi:hypothetical protein
MFKIKKSKGDALRKFIDNECQNVESIGGHVIGISLVNKTRNICLVLLPKNASTSLSTSALTSTSDDWLPFNFLKEDPDLRYVVVLRDPVDRFISALNMFLTSGKNIYDSLPIIFRREIATEDCHFCPQSNFISKLPLDRVDFFFHNKNVLEEIEQHYDIKFNEDAKHENASKKLVTAIDEELIKTLYAKDYELINSVKFINI